MTCASVTQDERLTLSKRPSIATMANTAPKIVTFEMVLVLRWKIWGIGDRRGGATTYCKRDAERAWQYRRAAIRKIPEPSSFRRMAAHVLEREDDRQTSGAVSANQPGLNFAIVA